jgi:hypothetical protein
MAPYLILNQHASLPQGQPAPMTGGGQSADTCADGTSDCIVPGGPSASSHSFDAGEALMVGSIAVLACIGVGMLLHSWAPPPRPIL